MVGYVIAPSGIRKAKQANEPMAHCIGKLFIEVWAIVVNKWAIKIFQKKILILAVVL